MPTDDAAARDSLRRLSSLQLALLTLLRVAIGWHFLYEGLAKLLDPSWSAGPFLDLSRWVLAPFFRWAASQPAALAVIDAANVWGLVLIGACLMLGLFTRLAAAGGVALLALYYVAHPALAGLGLTPPAEGQYLIVNKNIVELVALAAVLAFPTGRFAGLDRLVGFLRRRRRGGEGIADCGLRIADSGGRESVPAPQAERPRGALARRDILASVATAPFVGAFVVALLRRRGWQSHERRQLQSGGVDAVTSATIKSFRTASLGELKGRPPRAKIGSLELGRMILGGNLIGGWAHARDLRYVDRLVKAYHHRDKVFETLLLAEKCGIDAVLTNPVLSGLINEYWRRQIGSIRFISDCAGGKLPEMVRRSLDRGAAACYVMGGEADEIVRRADELARKGRPAESAREIGRIAQALELMRAGGVPAGIGAHKLRTVQACAAAGILPDFWMKTLHTLDYWSAGPKDRNDSVWCEEPAETIAFMRDRPEPWIAFKVLAAGAINPWNGFRHALLGGADLLCVGMYDFQIVEDVNVMVDVLAEVEASGRDRPWRA